LLTVRSSYVAAHAGQIGFPGGGVEPGESSRDAAVRELGEELGIAAQDVHLVGRLSPVYLFASNYVVTPWVAFSGARPALRPNPQEVASVLEVPLADLLAPQCRVAGEITQRGVTLVAPHFLWQGHCIWGGTAMMLAELIAVLSEIADDRSQPLGELKAGV
jgi:8-oxo-dGTP pyrophosphatase MutT (NUDIX family)